MLALPMLPRYWPGAGLIYDIFTAESIAAHMPGAVTCVRCKMLYQPRVLVIDKPPRSIRDDCPFCEIFANGSSIDLQPMRPLP